MMQSRLAATVIFALTFACGLVDALPALAQDSAPAPAALKQTNGTATATAIAMAPRAPLDDAWYGSWTGVAVSPAAAGKTTAPPEMPVTITVTRGETLPTVQVTVMRAGALAKAADDVVADGRTLAFTLNASNRTARFEATLDEGLTTSTGSFAFVGADGAFMQPLARWTMRRVNLVTEVASARVYDAVLEVAGQKLPMRLALGEGTFGWCGALDITQQGLRNFAVGVTRTDTGFIIVLEVGARATITLTADAEGTSLTGTFAQGAFVGPIHFTEALNATFGDARRLQDPMPPFAYRDREVRISHPAGHTLVGTLSMPSMLSLAREGRVPAIVLVTGSGPQDRDEALVGHRPFLVIADALATAGIAVLRYDDRGVGSSTGDFNKATTLDLSSDADIASEWLKQQEGIDPTRVGMLGHSEGGAIAPIVALWQHTAENPTNPLAFTVLLAPPAELGGALLTHQTKQLYDAAGIPEATSADAVAAHGALMSAMIARRPNDEIRPLVDDMVRKQIIAGGQAIPDDATMKSTIDGAMAQILHPWMAEFIRFDPRSVLMRLSVPTLAMCGTKDVQVNAATNLGIIDAIAAQTNAEIVTRSYPGLNHLFQFATTGGVEEYAVIETTFDPAALRAMVDWVVTTATRVSSPRNTWASATPISPDENLPPRLYLPLPAASAKAP